MSSNDASFIINDLVSAVRACAMHNSHDNIVWEQRAWNEALAALTAAEGKAETMKVAVLTREELHNALWFIYGTSSYAECAELYRKVMGHDHRLRELLRWMCYAEDAHITAEIEQIISGE